MCIQEQRAHFRFELLCSILTATRTKTRHAPVDGGEAGQVPLQRQQKRLREVGKVAHNKRACLGACRGDDRACFSGTESVLISSVFSAVSSRTLLGAHAQELLQELAVWRNQRLVRSFEALPTSDV